MNKRLYKVTLTGWVIKEGNDSEVMSWTKETVLNSIMGEQLVATFIDSNESTVEVKKDNELKSSEQVVYATTPPPELPSKTTSNFNPAQEGIEAAKAEGMDFTLDRYDDYSTEMVNVEEVDEDATL